MERVGRMGQSREANRDLLKEPVGKRPLEDLGIDGKNITINFQGTRWHRLYWIHLIPVKDAWWKLY